MKVLWTCVCVRDPMLGRSQQTYGSIELCDLVQVLVLHALTAQAALAVRDCKQYKTNVHTHTHTHKTVQTHVALNAAVYKPGLPSSMCRIWFTTMLWVSMSSSDSCCTKRSVS